MSRAESIELKLTEALELAHLEVINESHGHNVPAGSESHFKVVLVAADFEGLSRIDRHRQVNALMADEFDSGLHALAVHPYTEAEWRKRHGNAPMSPPCASGGDHGGH